MRHRETAELEIGIQRLHVAQDGLAGGGVAVVAHRGGAGQRGNDPRIAEIVRDQAEAALLKEPVAVERYDAGRLLPAVLQGVQPERGEGCGVWRVPNAEDAAFLMHLVVVITLGKHRNPSYGRAGAAPSARPTGFACNRSAEPVCRPAGGTASAGRYSSGNRCATQAAPR